MFVLLLILLGGVLGFLFDHLPIGSQGRGSGCGAGHRARPEVSMVTGDRSQPGGYPGRKASHGGLPGTSAGWKLGN